MDKYPALGFSHFVDEMTNLHLVYTSHHLFVLSTALIHIALVEYPTTRYDPWPSVCMTLPFLPPAGHTLLAPLAPFTQWTRA